ncbi:hypothetical protein ACFSUJ_35310 [Streptomyces lusitanus]
MPGRPGQGSRRTEADEQIVRAMVQLAHALGLTVTARASRAPPRPSGSG